MALKIYLQGNLCMFVGLQVLADVAAGELEWEEVTENDTASEHNFTGQRQHTAAVKPILDYVNIYLTLEFLSFLCKCTNEYARRWVENHREHMDSKPKCSVHKWIKEGGVTVNEMTVFLAYVINMGLVRKPTLASYWNTCNPSQCTPWFNI